jgi:predicted DNA-binding transcriptional regulator YafY
MTAVLRASSLDEVLTVLRSAVRDETPVLLDYATPAGIESTAEVVPLTLSGGYLTAVTQPGLAIETYSLARIMGVEAVQNRRGH